MNDPVTDSSDAPIKVSGICGSFTPDGATRKSLAIALKGANECDAETELVELREFDLPFCGIVAPDE